MIEISCTKTEMEKIIRALERGNLLCLFPRKAEHCVYDVHWSCRKCLEKNIKWNIQKRSSKGGNDHGNDSESTGTGEICR